MPTSGKNWVRIPHTKLDKLACQAKCVDILNTVEYPSSAAKKFDKERSEVSRSKRIIVEGGATLDGAGGWLFITNEGIEYYTHQLNFDHRSFKLCHDDIQFISKDGRNLVIVSNGTKRVFIVNYIDTWLSKINHIC